MRAVLASDLLTRLEEMTGIQGNTHFGEAEKYAILTSAVADAWDTIISSGIGTEFVKNVSFTADAGTREYDIETIVTDGDFYKVSQICVDEGNGHFRPISRINPAETWGYRSPIQSATIKLYYVQCAPVWVDGSESFDGINGWEELVLNIAAMTIKKKVEDDYRPYAQRKQELEKRIHTMGNRNSADPPRVVRRAYTARRSFGYFHPYNNNVSGWDIRGANLELLYREGVYA